MRTMELGLIGSGISRSMAPMLHETLGAVTGHSVRYTLHETDTTNAESVPALIDMLVRQGLRGVNVTHPFKGLAAELVEHADPLIAAIGAVNTVLFDSHRLIGHNTDRTGFQAAFVNRFPERHPGRVAVLGAGGFGRAAAFAMAALGADEVRLFDPDPERAESLAADLDTNSATRVSVDVSAERASAPAHGVINASPVGMFTHPGCPIDPDALVGRSWAAEAVYAPMRTEFVLAAERAGAEVLLGAETFFWQGVQAFELFTGHTLTETEVDHSSDAVTAEVDRRTAAGA